MPKCIPCLGRDVKDFIKQQYPGRAVVALLDSVKDCPDTEPMRLCQARDGRKGRAPSAYNIFIGQCLKSKPIAGKGFGAAQPYFKECVDEWRQKRT